MKQYVLSLLLIVALSASAQATVQLNETTSVESIPAESRRSIEQTFLTFPEWYLVHSPAEYARYVAKSPAHGFPFLGHLGQLWEGYARVTQEQIRAGYPANPGYHVMILVLAVSTTVEYTLRWAYENTLGRLSWASSSGVMTPEDQYAAKVAQDYVDFIRHEPWYLYDFRKKLSGLWTDTPALGKDMFRKWERRYVLTSEYGVKMAYAWLIEKATRASYVPALMTTLVETDRVPQSIPDGLDIHLIRRLPNGGALMSLPRYFDFKAAVTALAAQGISVTDIAGNRSVIFLTIWAAENKTFEIGDARTLFEQPILTKPGKKRMGLVLPVSKLSQFLSQSREQAIEIEHVHDY